MLCRSRERQRQFFLAARFRPLTPATRVKASTSWCQRAHTGVHVTGWRWQTVRPLICSHTHSCRVELCVLSLGHFAASQIGQPDNDSDGSVGHSAAGPLPHRCARFPSLSLSFPSFFLLLGCLSLSTGNCNCHGLPLNRHNKR